MKKGLLVLCFMLTGCGSDSMVKGNRGDNGNPPLKPMPAECTDKDVLEVHIKWPYDSQAYLYRYEFGYQNAAPFDEQTEGTNSVGYSYVGLKRGKKYYFNVDMQNKAGQMSFRSLYIEVPKCADRTKYQEDHPEYGEPLDFDVQFKD